MWKLVQFDTWHTNFAKVTTMSATSAVNYNYDLAEVNGKWFDLPMNNHFSFATV